MSDKVKYMNRTDKNLILNKHFEMIEKIILSRQDPITGLLPASTAINAHGDYTDAWVRDNVYSILSVWGLSSAYKKHDPYHHNCHILTQSVIKLMRGLLSAMMRQSSKVEAFKNTLNPIDSLHAKYGTSTGLEVVGDDEWGHLQLDATSIFLLMIAQMTASGLKLVYTMDEVNFIQNLVHYISRTYCTADYGIWERGNKINHGTTEINCSSVGMAKAALEAMDGFNLFGNVSSQEAVIHVVPNDIARSRFTLFGLLPRESNSKETDAALLSIIGYPAYAVEDEELVFKTKDKILKKLAGNYGCKRFLLDGHQSSIEDESRLHYEPNELREFEHIESEWPLFFTYLLLDSLMRNDTEEVKKWKSKLEMLFVEQEGIKLLPELYIVPKASIEAEKQNPGSQQRVPNENIPLVWAQSLYMLSDMIMDGILRPSDIDPLNRRERIGYKRVAQPLTCILAGSDRVKKELLNIGITSQTLSDVAPVKIMYARELSRVHTYIGKNEKLNLSGRAFLETRTISTSQMYKLAGEEVLFLPYYFDPKAFYFSYDSKLLTDHFKSSLKFLADHWDKAGQPIIPFLVREDMLFEKDKDTLLELLNDIQNGQCGGVSIKAGLLNQLLNTASIERIDFLHDLKLEEINLELRDHFSCDLFIEHKDKYNITSKKLNQLQNSTSKELSEIIIKNKNRLKSAIALNILWHRERGDFKIVFENEEKTLLEIGQEYYKQAEICHDWAVVRRVADTTSRYDDRIEDALLDIVVRQKQLAVGRAYHEKAVLSQPLDSIAIVKRIIEFSGDNTAESVLIQEIILHLGHLIRRKPELFENILTLRTWYYVQLLVGEVSFEYDLSIADAYEFLLSLSPYEIYDKLHSILESFAIKVSQLKDQETLNISGVSNIDNIKSIPLNEDDQKVDDWAKWRKEAGLLGVLSEKLNKNIWYILQQCKGIVIGDKYHIQNRISSEQTLESTANERSFELFVDKRLQNIPAPDYRQLNIELIDSLSRIFRQNPDIYIENDLVFDVLIGYAVRIAWCKNNSCDNYDEYKGRAWEAMYKLSPNEVDSVFVESFRHLVKGEK